MSTWSSASAPRPEAPRSRPRPSSTPPPAPPRSAPPGHRSAARRRDPDRHVAVRSTWRPGAPSHGPARDRRLASGASRPIGSGRLRRPAPGLSGPSQGLAVPAPSSLRPRPRAPSRRAEIAGDPRVGRLARKIRLLRRRTRRSPPGRRKAPPPAVATGPLPSLAGEEQGRESEAKRLQIKSPTVSAQVRYSCSTVAVHRYAQSVHVCSTFAARLRHERCTNIRVASAPRPVALDLGLPPRPAITRRAGSEGARTP